MRFCEGTIRTFPARRLKETITSGSDIYVGGQTCHVFLHDGAAIGNAVNHLTKINKWKSCTVGIVHVFVCSCGTGPNLCVLLLLPRGCIGYRPMSTQNSNFMKSLFVTPEI